MTNLRRAIMTAAMAVMATGMSSCAALGFVAETFKPPERVPAMYKPPEGLKVLVFVDDIRGPISYGVVKQELAERVGKLLVEHKIAGQVIPYERLLNMATSTPDFNSDKTYGVVEVGRKLDADLVLYVEIVRFSLKENETSPLWEGRLSLNLRWVDARATSPEKARLWPKETTERVGYDLPLVTTPAVEDASLDYGAQAARDLAQTGADAVARCFYDYTVQTD